METRPKVFVYTYDPFGVHPDIERSAHAIAKDVLSHVPPHEGKVEIVLPVTREELELVRVCPPLGGSQLRGYNVDAGELVSFVLSRADKRPHAWTQHPGEQIRNNYYHSLIFQGCLHHTLKDVFGEHDVPFELHALHQELPSDEIIRFEHDFHRQQREEKRQAMQAAFHQAVADGVEDAIRPGAVYLVPNTLQGPVIAGLERKAEVIRVSNARLEQASGKPSDFHATHYNSPSAILPKKGAMPTPYHRDTVVQRVRAWASRRRR